MRSIKAVLLVALLPGCQMKAGDITGPELQECVNSETGEKYRFRKSKITGAARNILTGEASISFVDEKGWSRTASTSDSDASQWKCREIKESPPLQAE